MSHPEVAARGNPLARLLLVRPGEWTRLVLAFAYFFFLLGGYFMLRPLRGTVAASNADVLHWLYTATFTCMVLLVPVFGWLVAHFRRSRFIPTIYLFFFANLLAFAGAFDDAATPVLVQRVFYVWLSVFNLFVVSVFWSFMTDIFRPGEAQRLFGTIMAGGSLGAIAGPLATAQWVAEIGARGVMQAAAACLLVALGLAVVLGRWAREHHEGAPDTVIGGGVWEGATRVFRSRYLLYACLLMLCHNLASTFLYNGLAVLVDRGIEGFAARTEFFSYVDLAVQVIAFSLQFFITARLVRRAGMPRTLVLVPALLAFCFVLLGSSLGLVLFAAVQVVQRALNYGVLGPTKEMLFTVVDRETRYKCKNFIDTVVYRGSDVAASWLFRGFVNLGWSIGQMAWAYLPLMAAWAWGAWRLGALYEAFRESGEASPGDAPPAGRKRVPSSV